jgi:cell division ATPase FtsA
MAKEYKDLVVGLDIGTAKVMVVVAEVMPGGELKLAGLGVAPSNGSSGAWWSTSTPPCKASSSR